MTGKTHRVGGMLCCLGGYSLLKANGMLLGDVNPLLQLVVMYPFAIYGSTVSDLDHDWHSAPSRDIISYGINKTLHLTSKVRDNMNEKSPAYKALGVFDAKHRSWQTHSDLFLVLMIMLSTWLLGSGISSVDQVLVRLVSVGLILGVISHLVLDMLTPEGVWSIIMCVVGKVTKSRKLPRKISFVPNTEFFRTGGTWENLIRCLMWIACFILFAIIMLEYSPYSIDFLKS